MKKGIDLSQCARHLHSSECEYAYSSWSTAPHWTYNLGVKNALAARYPNTVFVYELGPLMCDGRVCNSQVPGTSLRAYDDYHHLSSAAALYHAPYLCAAMDAWRWLGLSYPLPASPPLPFGGQGGAPHGPRRQGEGEGEGQVSGGARRGGLEGCNRPVGRSTWRRGARFNADAEVS